MIGRVPACALLGAALLTTARPCCANDDDIQRRERLLSIGMERMPLVPPREAHPSSAAPSLVWQDRVQHSADTPVSVHISVAAPANAAAWNIRVLDKDDRTVEEIASTEPCWASGACWTAPVSGGEARLQLWTAGSSDPYAITLDAYTFATIPSAAQATVGADEKQDIGEASPAIRALAPPIARLVIMSRGAYCTGFLVSPELVLTNEHCVANDSDALSTTVEFNYEKPRVVPERRYRVRRFEVADPGLDYAVVRISPEAGATYGRLRLDPDPDLQNGRHLVLIQHPAGQRKMFVDKNCVLSGTSIPGSAQTNTDFGHTCDTLQGSSGAPVIGNPGSNVVGLHHWQFDEHDAPVNQAVHIDLILADIREKKMLQALANEMLAP
jgi:hypothetical protein